MSSHVRPEVVEPNGHIARVSDLLRLRPVGIDDWSSVRYVHENAFRTLVAPHVSPAAAEAFLSSLREPEYVDALLACDVIGAWFDGELVGTAGWRPVPGGSALARIEGLFVRPLLTFMGIGSTLLIQAEHRAREAGFDTFVATVPAVSVPFLMRFGYEAVAHGPGLPGSTVRDEPLFLMRKRETLAADLATGLLPDAVVAGE